MMNSEARKRLADPDPHTWDLTTVRTTAGRQALADARDQAAQTPGNSGWVVWLDLLARTWVAP